MAACVNCASGLFRLRDDLSMLHSKTIESDPTMKSHPRGILIGTAKMFLFGESPRPMFRVVALVWNTSVQLRLEIWALSPGARNLGLEP